VNPFSTVRNKLVILESAALHQRPLLADRGPPGYVRCRPVATVDGEEKDGLE